VHLDPILDGLQTDFAMLFVNGMGQRINIDRVPAGPELDQQFRYLQLDSVTHHSLACSVLKRGSACVVPYLIKQQKTRYRRLIGSGHDVKTEAAQEKSKRGPTRLATGTLSLVELE
jgi:hypothetical protein